MRAVAEAPSKVIITGEHFVVHGAWALAAAVGKRTRVEVRSSDEFAVRSTALPSTALLPAAEVSRAMASEFSFRLNFTINITSEVPAGAGLGSSASTMVAVASAISRFQSLDLGTERIIASAGVGERVIHGKPSGIDAAVCGRGGVILYRPGTGAKRVLLKGERRILVVNSGTVRSTGRLVRRVSGVRKRSPHFFTSLAASVSDLSLAASHDLARGDMEGLGRLITLNHAALVAIGVSTRQLDGIVDLLLSLGCFGAKLTGAGGGGSVLAVLPEGKEKRAISQVRERGLEAFVSVIPAEGVRSWLEQ